MTTCELCGEGPASVFKPTIAVCKPCNRELERRDIEDNPIPNEPTCATCGTVLNQSGTCAECVTRSVTEGHRRMAVAS